MRWTSQDLEFLAVSWVLTLEWLMLGWASVWTSVERLVDLFHQLSMEWLSWVLTLDWLRLGWTSVWTSVYRLVNLLDLLSASKWVHSSGPLVPQLSAGLVLV